MFNSISHVFLSYFCGSFPSFLQAEQPYEGFPTYYAWLRSEYIRKRDILMQARTHLYQGLAITKMA